MSASESPSMERFPQLAQQQQLTFTSVIGGALFLASLWLIFAGLPWFWGAAWASVFAENATLKTNAFLSGALLILSELVVIGGLCYLGFNGLQKQTLPGVRAGMFFFAVILFAAFWVCIVLGQSLEDQFSDNAALGWGVVALVSAAIIGGAAYVYLKVPAWQSFLETVEHQGWFTGTSYKGNQGVRVRRATIIGILAVAMSGIVTMAIRKSFGIERADSPNDWEAILPFSDRLMYIPLMFKLQIALPILLGILAIWLAWRIVNIPTFGDFLIATEAEMNKVSWTNRRRLFQDTIVVLTAVFLFTAFLFAVDVVWIQVLSMRGVKVLLIDPRAEQQKQQQKAEW
jgi:preprotein translocase SecE subunit